MIFLKMSKGLIFLENALHPRKTFLENGVHDKRQSPAVFRHYKELRWTVRVSRTFYIVLVTGDYRAHLSAKFSELRAY